MKNFLSLKKGAPNDSIQFYMVFTDLKESATLKQIKEKLGLKRGIYAFVRNETKKAYVGSSMKFSNIISCGAATKQSLCMHPFKKFKFKCSLLRCCCYAAASQQHAPALWAHKGLLNNMV
jgi:hypothetical protein